MLALTLALALVFVYGLVPGFVRLFLRAQERAGNAALPFNRWLTRHEAVACCVVWAVFSAGLSIAWPAMVRDFEQEQLVE